MSEKYLCTTHVSKFTGVVQNLIISDPRYKNFDNVATLILQSKLGDEQKTQSLKNIALIYKGLATIISGQGYNAGKADEFIKLEMLADIPDAYVRAAASIYDLKQVQPLTLKKVEQLIAAANMSQQPELTVADQVREALKAISSYIKNATFDNGEARTYEINRLMDLLRAAIAYHKHAKGLYENQIISAHTALTATSPYVALVSVLSQAQLDTKTAFMKDGSFIEGTYEDGVFTSLHGEEVPRELIITRQDTYKVNMFSRSNTSKMVLYPTGLTTGFVISAFNEKDRAAIEKRTQNMTSLAGVKIYAVPVNGIGDNRIDRLQSFGEGTALANRTLETYETPEQRRYLSQGENREAVSVYRPKASVNKYSFIGELPSGERFFIYNPSNFAFIDSNNNTKVVDLNNPEHVAKFRSLSTKLVNGMEEELSDEDIASLVRANELYKELEKNITPDGSIMQDITDLFDQTYVAVKTAGGFTKITLDEHVDYKSNKYKHKVTLVTRDKTGKIISRDENAHVPVIFYRNQQGNSFKVAETLQEDEYIERPNGELVKMRAYAEEQMKYNRSFIDTLLGENRNSNINTFIVYSTGSRMTFRILESNHVLHDVQQFANFTLELSDLLERTEKMSTYQRNDAFKTFTNTNYRFSFSERNGRTLYVNLAVNEHNQLQVEIRGNKEYDAINQHKSQFNFVIGNGHITALRDYLTKSKQVLAFIADQPALRDLDLSKKENILTVFSEVNRLAPVSSEARKIVNNFRELEARFGKVLKEAIVDKLPGRMAGIVDPALLDEDFKGKLYHLIANADTNENGELQFRPKIQAMGNNAAGFYGNPNNYHLIEQTSSKISFDVRYNTTKPSVVHKEAAAIPAPVKTKPSGIKRQDRLQLEQEFKLAREKDIAQSVAWLREALPQFDLSEDDLADIIDMASFDGHVLGMFRDRMIYLNRTMTGKGTLYHEAFHGVFRHLMDSAQRRLLLDTVIADKKHSNRFTAEAVREFARRRKLPMNEDIVDLIAEEILADGFQNHMLNKTKPAGIIAKLFALLKKLINMLVKNDILRTYEKISNGGYSSASVQSNIYEGKYAYEIIPGNTEIYTDHEDEVAERRYTMSALEQKQLITRMAHEILSDKSPLSFEDKLKKHSEAMFELFDINNLIKQRPSAEAEIRTKYGPLYENYRYILGEGKFLPINTSGDAAYDNYDEEDFIRDNTDAKAVFKNLVQHKLRHFDISDQHTSELDEEDIATASDYEDSYYHKNVLDNLPEEMRANFSLISYLEEDSELGIKIPKMIDGSEIFNTIMKITSDVPVSSIVEEIRLAADQFAYDKEYTAAKELDAVYKKIEQVCGIVKGVPTKNKQLYKQIQDVFHTTELEQMLFRVRSRELKSDPDSTNIPLVDTTFTLKDSLVKADVDARKGEIMSNFLVNYRKVLKKDAATQASFKAQVSELRDIIDRRIITGTQVVDVVPGDMELERLTSDLHARLSDIGFNIPKSLIRLSILSIDIAENGHTPDYRTSLKFFKQHELNYVNTRKYLEKDFFKDLNKILGKMENLQSYEAVKYFTDKDRNNEEDKDENATLKRFNAILGKASEYIIKYDPKDLPSVTRNAENKSIYRYVKYTPVATMTQHIRQKGLKSFIQGSRFYHTTRAFFNDNPWVKSALSTDRTKENEMHRMFFENIKVSSFAGVRQTLRGAEMEGKTFKTIDDRSFYLANLYAFMKRSKITQKRKVGTGEQNLSITVYDRTLTQNEASQTNFLVTAMHREFFDHEGKEKRFTYAKKSYANIAKSLEHVIRQEYNRAQREWRNREQLKSDYEKGVNNIINKYNGIKKDGRIVTDDRENLRAYQFNMLPDFAKSNDTLAKLLMDSATIYDLDFDALLEDTRSALYDALDKYATEQFEKHLGVLKDLNIVTETDITPEGWTGAKEFTYTSQVIPKKITVLSSKVENIPVEDIYGKAGKTPNVGALLKDHFYNYFVNSLMVNPVFFSDQALTVSGFVNYFKRHKSLLSAGSTMKEGFHRVAIIDDLVVWMHPDHPEYGQFDSEEDVVEALGSAEGFKEHLAADGQSYSTLMHVIDGYDSQGRLNDEALKLLIALNYRALTPQEIKYLEKQKIVNNSKKTVTSSSEQYHKLSEHSILRQDVSNLIIPEGRTSEEVYEKLDSLYYQIYHLRQQRHEQVLENQKNPDLIDALNEGKVHEIEQEISSLYKQVRTHWEAKPHRKFLHELLNSMEHYNVDQVMDTNASKKLTMLPVSYTERNSEGVIPLNMSLTEVPNQYKYFQVETSGVHDMATISVQSKLLVAADYAALQQMINSSDPDEVSYAEETLAELAKYQEALRNTVNADFSKMKLMMRDEDGNFDMKEILSAIRESLIDQGANPNQVKLFDLNPDGTPVHSINLPIIKETIKYYFFSTYSNNVTVEKGAGFKSFHVSSYGYQVLTAKTDIILDKLYLAGQVIPTHIADKYKLTQEQVSARYPKVTSEVVGGKTHYYVECIVPRPHFKTADEEEFYMQHMTRMFATRIPTEDKRSMVSLKVVDFIDSAYLNSIVVPQIVHELAGSDLDIDALYGQMFAHFRDINGQMRLYGQANSNPARYMEYVHYMISHMKKEYNTRVNEIWNTLKSEEETGATLDFNAAAPVLRALGIPKDIVENIVNIPHIQEVIDTLYDTIEELKEERDDTFSMYVPAVEESERNPSRELSMYRGELSAEIRDLTSRIGEAYRNADMIHSDFKLIKDAFRKLIKASAFVDVMRMQGYPATYEEFLATDAYKYVTPAFQNHKLNAQINLLSNPSVYKYLYITQKADTKEFKKMLKIVGRTPKDIVDMFNGYTLDGVVNAKKLASGGKDGISLTANLNKFMAIASQYGLTFHDMNEPVYDEEGNEIPNYNDNHEVIWYMEGQAYKTFGGLAGDSTRTIATMGKILGMFADAAKDPIPGALGVNTINAGVTLSMIAVGLPKEFAFFVNLLPEVQNAVRIIEESQTAIGTVKSKDLFLSNVISNENERILNDKTVLAQLVEAGILRADSSVHKRKLVKEAFTMSYNIPRSIDTKKISVEGIGLTITANNGSVLSEDAQRVVLLQLYKEQAQQYMAIVGDGSVSNMFKHIKPDFNAFDRMMQAYEKLLTNTSLFANSNIMFDNQVYSVFADVIRDMDEQARKLFIERSLAFKPFVDMYGALFKDKTKLANIIVGVFGMHKYINSYEKAEAEEGNPRAILNRSALLAMTQPEYWFGLGDVKQLGEQIEEALEIYPDNKFLLYLRVVKNQGSQVKVIKDGVQVYDPNILNLYREQYIQQTGKIKTQGEFAEEVIDDGTRLFNDLRTRALYKQLVNHELIRGGLSHKPGMFLSLIDSDMLKGLSGYIKDFTAILEKRDFKELVNDLKDYLGTNFHGVLDVLENLVYQTVYAAKDEGKIFEQKVFKLAEFMPQDSAGINTEYAKRVVQHIYDISDEQFRKFVAGAYELNLGMLIRDDSLSINLAPDEDIPHELMIQFALKMGIKPEQFGEYTFPVAFSTPSYYGKKFVLKSINGKRLGNYLVASLVSDVTFTGTYAEYEMMPDELTSASMSPVAFTRENALKYRKLNNGEIAIEIGTAKEAAPDNVEPWSRYAENNYEVSSEGDKRFSALYAMVTKHSKRLGKDITAPIEWWYQSEMKGHYQQPTVSGHRAYSGKGKSPVKGSYLEGKDSYTEYKKLWELFAKQNPSLISELAELSKGKTLTDKFAKTGVSQAQALSEILHGAKAQTVTKPQPGQQLDLFNIQPPGRPDIDITDLNNC